MPDGSCSLEAELIAAAQAVLDESPQDDLLRRGVSDHAKRSAGRVHKRST